MSEISNKIKELHADAYSCIDMALANLRKIEDIFDEMDEEVRTQNKTYAVLHIFYMNQYNRLWLIQANLDCIEENYK